MKFRHSYAISRQLRKLERGLTLAEVLIVMAIFGLLMTTIFAFFRLGLNAFHKSTTKNELHQQIQVLTLRLIEELQMSSVSSVSLEPAMDGDTLGFLSAVNNDGDFVLDVRGRPDWQKYVIYYFNSSEGKVFRREVPLVAGASERRVPTPIEFYDPGTGREPLSFYATGGQPVARLVTAFVVNLQPAPVSQVQWEITAERTRYGLDSSTPETLTGRASGYLRN